MELGVEPLTVYVDDMRRRAQVGRINARWSHLFADTHEELMQFSRLLGMKPQWLQHEGTHREHFDLVDDKRDWALRLGALPLRYPSEVGTFMREKRARMEEENARYLLRRLQAPLWP